MNNKEKYTWLSSLLKGWGVKESWAKVLAGAIIGGLVAAGVLAASSCTVSYKQSATGGIEFSSAIVTQK